MIHPFGFLSKQLSLVLFTCPGLLRFGDFPSDPTILDKSLIVVYMHFLYLKIGVSHCLDTDMDISRCILVRDTFVSR
jgi:hypothetical protein